MPPVRVKRSEKSNKGSYTYNEIYSLAFKQVINDQTYLIVKNQKFKWDLLLLNAIINEDDTSNVNDSSVEKPFVFIGLLYALCRYKESGLATNFRAKFYNKVKQIYQLEVNQKTKEPPNSIKLKYASEIISHKFEDNTYERMDNDHIPDFVRHFIQWITTLNLVEDEEPNFKLFITKFNGKWQNEYLPSYVKLDKMALVMAHGRALGILYKAMDLRRFNDIIKERNEKLFKAIPSRYIDLDSEIIHKYAENSVRLVKEEMTQTLRKIAHIRPYRNKFKKRTQDMNDIDKVYYELCCIKQSIKNRDDHANK